MEGIGEGETVFLANKGSALRRGTHGIGVLTLAGPFTGWWEADARGQKSVEGTRHELATKCDQGEEGG